MNKSGHFGQYFTMASIFLIGLLMWNFEAPQGISLQAWHMLIIFLCTIAGVVANPLPMGAIAVIGIAVLVLTGTLSLAHCVAGFGTETVWLVLFAFFISIGFIKTGLGSRIAYYFISKIGRTTLGLSYGLVLADFFLSPLIPSVIARGGGIIFPIANALTKSYQDQEHPGVSGRTGGFLMQVCLQSNVITSALFLTAMAANPIVVDIASKHQISISWTDWAIAACVPGLINLFLMPLVIFMLYPPSIKHSESAPKIARQKLKEMGVMKWQEVVMLITFVLLISLWIFGKKMYGITEATTALIGFCVLLLTRVLTFEDATADKGAWHTFVWFATLVMMSKWLSDLGVMKWLGESFEAALIGLDPVLVVTILGLFYFYIHYLFASATAHILVLLPTFLLLFISIGVPPKIAVFILGFASILSGGITHFSIGSAPVFFGAGHMKIKSWWYVGFIISVFNLIVWSVAGSMWWKVIGLW